MIIVVYIGIALFGLGILICVLSRLVNSKFYEMPLSAIIGVALIIAGISVALSAGFTMWLTTYNIF